MRHLVTLLLLVSLCTVFGAAQRPDRRGADQPAASSPSQLLKMQHEEIKKMSARLTELATEVEEEVEKNGENVLPLNTLKKLDEIEKLARKLRGRMKQ